MELINDFLLKAVAFFNPFFERNVVDTYQINHILRLKLLLDKRRPKAIFSGRRGSAAAAAAAAQTDNGGISWRVIIVTLIMGSLYGAVLFIFPSPMMGQTIYFMLFMLLMSMVLITDFTNVLMDVRDQYIILPRPVSDKTASMARILHITIYVIKLALMQGFPAMVMMGFIDGIAAVPLFLFQIIEATLFSIFMVNIVYLTLMRSVSPQRVKDIISYFQIGFSIIIFSIFRMPRLFNFLTVQHFDLVSHKWAYLIPSVWIASLNETLLHASRANYITAILAFVGIMVPFASIWLVANVLAPGFNRSLAIMAMSDGVTTTAVPKEVKKPGFLSKVANIVARSPVENAGYRITWKLAARTRDFKMKVYPSFAYWPVYIVYIVLSNKRNGNFLENIQNSNVYIFLLYISIFMLSTILQNITQSEKYKASWVYYALPVKKPGEVLTGMFKAIITLYILPFYIIVGITAMVIWGPSAINDILLAFFLNQILGMLLGLFLIKGPPFSKPGLTRKQAGRGFISLFILGIGFAIAFAHFLLARWETLIWVLAVLAFGINWLMYRYYRRQTWESIEFGE